MKLKRIILDLYYFLFVRVRRLFVKQQYLHEFNAKFSTTEERDLDIKKNKRRWMDFKEPPWCHYYPDPVSEMGCYSLIYGYVKTEDYCFKCEYHAKSTQLRKIAEQNEWLAAYIIRPYVSFNDIGIMEYNVDWLIDSYCRR